MFVGHGPTLLTILTARKSGNRESLSRRASMSNARTHRDHSLNLRTSPGRNPYLGLSVSCSFESVATWFAGITTCTAAKAASCGTAAAHSDLLPSGAVTSTTGILMWTLAILWTFRFPVDNLPQQSN